MSDTEIPTRRGTRSPAHYRGEAELLVAGLLGHTSVEMVRRNYGRWIKPADGIIRMRGDYSEKLGADLGQFDPSLNGVNPRSA